MEMPLIPFHFFSLCVFVVGVVRSCLIYYEDDHVGVVLYVLFALC